MKKVKRKTKNYNSKFKVMSTIKEEKSTKELRKELRKYADIERKKTNEWFFKTGKGEYGEHDKFLGISNPDVRGVAKKFSDLSFVELEKLIHSPFNEERFCALVILVNRYSKGRTKVEEKKRIYQFFLKNLKQVNNWNLVDTSAPHIIGEYLAENQKEVKILDRLSDSNFHWHRRVSILAAWGFIKRGELALTFRLAKKLLGDREDLMHKAVGWMLREAWKKDSQKTEKFLRENYQNLPRTTLRYAIERMEEKKRKMFLEGRF